MNTPYKFCPMCGHRVDNYYESEHSKPFVHTDPMKGLTIYGPFSAEKDVECSNGEFLHLKFSGGEHRLIRLGVTDPIGFTEFGEVSNEADENDLPW